VCRDMRSLTQSEVVKTEPEADTSNSLIFESNIESESRVHPKSRVVVSPRPKAESAVRSPQSAS
jgi:hypothetical protein